MAKVFSATGVEVITRTRTEHLPEGDKKKQKRKLLYYYIIFSYQQCQGQTWQGRTSASQTFAKIEMIILL